MSYYHVSIKTTGGDQLFCWGFSEIELKEQVVSPLRQNRNFFFVGKNIHPSEIAELYIYESTEGLASKIILPNGRTAKDESDWNYLRNCFNMLEVAGIRTCTSEFVSSLSIAEEKERFEESVVKSTRIGYEREKVFIGHGRDLEKALQLQKYLREDLKVDATLFEDLKKESGCSTIIELLDYFKKNVGYAFIIFTPDDYGCTREEIDKLTKSLYMDRRKSKAEAVSEMCEALGLRARQNVVFELGLFIGALERDRICYLLHNDVKDTPSNVDGVLHESFEKTISETFPSIAEKLRVIGIVKSQQQSR